MTGRRLAERRPSVRTRGLTLLELVIVVAILAAIATAAVAVTDQVDQQSRYDATKQRAREIHDAIVGPAGSLNGSPVVLGFVADMGRLPASLSELVSQAPSSTVSFPAFAPNSAASALPGFTVSGLPIGFGAGWRGPYVAADSELLAAVEGTTARSVFRDGWGNVAPGDAPATPDANFGWALVQSPPYLTAASYPPFVAGATFSASDSWILESKGSDNQLDTGTPATWDAADFALVLSPADYLVDVSGWQVSVAFSNAPPAASELRLYFPVTAATGGMSLAWLTASPQSTSGNTVVYRGFADTLTASPLPLVPVGVRALVVFSGGAPVAPTNGAPRTAPVPVTVAARAAQGPLAIAWND